MSSINVQSYLNLEPLTANVVVVGSCVVDLVFYTKHLPYKGETVLARFKRGLGGKGFNQAVAAEKSGSSVYFVSSTGVGTDSNNFQEALTAYDMRFQLQKHKELPTGMASITIEESGDNSIAVALGANEALSIEEDKFTLPDGCKVVLAQLETNLSAVLAVFRQAKRLNPEIITVLNPAPAPVELSDEFWELMSITDILTPNETELEAITGSQGIENMDASEIADICKKIPYVSDIITTLGERGCLHYSRKLVQTKHPTIDASFEFYKSHKVKALDTSGAGDAFNGGLVTGLVKYSASLPEAIKYATAIAAVSVQREGTSASMPTAEEVERFLNNSNGLQVDG